MGICPILLPIHGDKNKFGRNSMNAMKKFFVRKIVPVLLVLTTFVLFAAYAAPSIYLWMSRNTYAAYLAIALMCFLSLGMIASLASVEIQNFHEIYKRYDIPSAYELCHSCGVESPLDFCVVMSGAFKVPVYDIFCYPIRAMCDNQNAQNWTEVASRYKQMFNKEFDYKLSGIMSWNWIVASEARKMAGKEDITDEEFLALVSPSVREKYQMRIGK